MISGFCTLSRSNKLLRKVSKWYCIFFLYMNFCRKCEKYFKCKADPFNGGSLVFHAFFDQFFFLLLWQYFQYSCSMLLQFISSATYCNQKPRVQFTAKAYSRWQSPVFGRKSCNVQSYHFLFERFEKNRKCIFMHLHY